MKKSNEELYKEVTELIKNGTRVGVACKQVGMPPSVFSYWRKKEAGLKPKKSKIKHTTIHVQRDDSLIADYQSATLEMLSATTKLLKLLQRGSDHGAA